MHLLHMTPDGAFEHKTFLGRLPSYAILSHRWTSDEPAFQDIASGTARHDSKGYAKLLFCARQALADGLIYFWVDTVCIDKSSSAELAESLNSMFRWYRDAARCYVLMSDVTDMERDFDRSEWFRRGWTLQELLAPRDVEFFNRDGKLIGTKRKLEVRIKRITGIPSSALLGQNLEKFSVGARLGWMRKRETTIQEDRAYCLLGIFDVFMPVLYGEGGTNAFDRLKEAAKKNVKTTPHCLHDPEFKDLDRWCTKCGFCFRWEDHQTPRPWPPISCDGKEIPPKYRWQRFHVQRSKDPSSRTLPYNGDSYCFRCFLCPRERLMKMGEMMRHCRDVHTYDEICGPIIS